MHYSEISILPSLQYLLNDVDNISKWATISLQTLEIKFEDWLSSIFFKPVKIE